MVLARLVVLVVAPTTASPLGATVAGKGGGGRVHVVARRQRSPHTISAKQLLDLTELRDRMGWGVACMESEEMIRAISIGSAHPGIMGGVRRAAAKTSVTQSTPKSS